MKHALYYTLVFFAAFQSCGQKTQQSIRLSDLSFNSIFANSRTDSLHMYCLLGSGYFRTPRSDNADSLVMDWLIKHPNADVIPVSTLSSYPGSKMTYCWLVDGKDTLNNYLVRNGCFPGGTMLGPKKSNGGKETLELDFNVTVHIDGTSYNKFLDQIRAAEDYAKTNKLGIWNNK